ncbi:hypothetical protein V8G54_026009 [Vigna mungo]|uniref:Uncharacterized protein n=1 Tax=Vigna mungo TaxID=3915 RepID=A0AAQ3MY03_VIGMU
MPLDPATATTTASRPVSPLPQPHQHLPPQQQTLPIRAPGNPLLAKPHDPHFAYPFAPKGVRGLAAVDHSVSGGAFAPPAMVYGGVVRGMHLDYLSHALHVARPPHHMPFGHVGNAAATPTASPPVKKAASRSAVSDINGGKDSSTREKIREDTYIVVRDRKEYAQWAYLLPTNSIVYITSLAHNVLGSLCDPINLVYPCIHHKYPKFWDFADALIVYEWKPIGLGGVALKRLIGLSMWELLGSTTLDTSSFENRDKGESLSIPNQGRRLEEMRISKARTDVAGRAEASWAKQESLGMGSSLSCPCRTRLYSAELPLAARANEAVGRNLMLPMRK